MDHLDVFKGVKSEILYTTKYDEDCDIGTIYMGRSNMKRQDDLKELKVLIRGLLYGWNILG